MKYNYSDNLEKFLADRSNLEKVLWLNENEYSDFVEEGPPADKILGSFAEIRQSILDNGPIYLCTDRVNLIILVLSGRFDNELMIIRQSGRNIRKFLVKERDFEENFGTFEACIDHHMSNNAIDCEIEIAHLKDFLDHLDIDCDALDLDREYSRMAIDAIAAQQLINVVKKLSGDDKEDNIIFSIGYSVGRIFSSIQNLAILEGLADKGRLAEENYKRKGKNSGSDKRKKERLDAFIDEIEKVYKHNCLAPL